LRLIVEKNEYLNSMFKLAIFCLNYKSFIDCDYEISWLKIDPT